MTTRKVSCLLLAPLLLVCEQAALAEETEIELPSLSIEEEFQDPQAETLEGTEEQGYRVGSANAGVLGKLPLKDTPYSINATSAALIKNLQAQSVADALKYNPTVNSASGGDSVGGGGAFQIRGFVSENNESFIDGVRMYARAPMEDKERIEVLNGSASFLYGFANPAGLVNYTLKRPTAQRLATFTTGLYGGKQVYGHVDLGGPIDSQNRFGYRLNVVKVGKGETAVNEQHHGRYLLSGALDWNISPDTRLALDYSHFYADVEHGDDTFTVGNKVTSIPHAPDATKNYSPAYSISRDGYRRYGIEFDSRLNDIFTIRSKFNYTRILTYRRRAANNIITNDGDYTMSRSYRESIRFGRAGNIFLDANINTGPIAHVVTLGFSAEDGNTKNAYPYASKKISFPGINNLYHQDPYPDDVVGDTRGRANRNVEKLRMTSTTLADRITFNEQWSAIIGASHITIVDRNKSYSNYLKTGTFSRQPKNDKERTTPSFALTYKPLSNLSLYASYIESLQKGDTAPSTATNADEVMSPYMSRQVEAGIKSTWGEMDLNVAAFRIKKRNAYTDLVTNMFKMDGQEIHNGLEVVATGKVTRNLTMTGGFTLMKAYIDKATDHALKDKTPQGVPEKIARLYGEYALDQVPGLTLTGGLSYTGKIYVDSLNKLPIPSVFTGDIGARYKMDVFGKGITYRLNVSNLWGHDYWTTVGGTMSLGTPRNVALSATLDL
ncbi:TonB-dependent siderophore receptor [Azomonas macrocytogenes]|uniref:Iron complex outermembrane receptor protein n=1 Tax=Azomonas macrocytogenes TaxID=69962 RepID=A0A839T6F3_AZOMA|nr:TonB-dependent siderophore receptor [Azomonas macrocytogenes]MBB3103525.1 iron complex outermembrane receptor protein [Azomonas macrocytogenes]